MDEEPGTGGRGQPSTHDRGTAEVDALAVQFGEIARQLQSHPDTGSMLDDLVAAAVTTIPGAQDASISIVTGRTRVTSEHPTSELPARVDLIQTETGQGPCIDAAYVHQTVRVPDMRHEVRWPRFTQRAAAAGVGSMLSFQLYVEDDDLGALNLYSREPNAFDDESEQVGLLFASHAAVAFADARTIDHLHRAIDGRDLVGQAKGMLMERYGIDQDQAFAVLTRVSQNTHHKLRDLAAELVSTRRLRGLRDGED